MEIRHLIWIPHIVEKLIRKHGVERWEVWDLFKQRPRFHFMERGHVKGEHLYRALGRTGQGRFLAVFFIFKSGGKALIISGRDMTRAERRLYEKA